MASCNSEPVSDLLVCQIFLIQELPNFSDFFWPELFAGKGGIVAGESLVDLLLPSFTHQRSKLLHQKSSSCPFQGDDPGFFVRFPSARLFSFGFLVLHAEQVGHPCNDIFIAHGTLDSGLVRFRRRTREERALPFPSKRPASQ